MGKIKPIDDFITDRVANISDDTLSDLIGYNIKRASNVIQCDMARTLKPLGLRMITFSALVLIVDNPGIRQSQLADALAIERPNCVVIIDDLEHLEMITRLRVPTDRRAYALNVTLAGRQLYKKALRALKMQEKTLFAGFTDKQRLQIRDVMELVASIRNLDCSS
jgi:DNA-binding MarR family transcriptional regulator